MYWLHLLEPLITFGSRIYLIASEVFTITLILWCINFMANLIEKLYLAGITIGRFYYQHKIGDKIKDLTAKLIALVVLATELIILGVRVIQRDHKDWLNKANDLRNQIGGLFTLPEITYG